ncbi:PAS domain-containing protein [Desulfovibrio oxyclinae]|uniref:sensor histidine kinase n=1 Tax=Desulfovibrio oxyclinae TaxID=63560 RepID=UPI0009FBC692|nr:PAS domain-containing protein [Desulfovibrio oxyclinae]
MNTAMRWLLPAVACAFLAVLAWVLLPGRPMAFSMMLLLLLVCCLVLLLFYSRTGKSQELASSESLAHGFHSVSDNLPAAILRTAYDERRPVDYVSEHIQKLAGYAPESFLKNGRDFVSIILPDDRHRVAARIQEAAAEAREFVAEYRIMHADGVVRWVQERGRLFEMESGTRIDSVLVDIMDRKRAEKDNNQRKWLDKGLEELDRSLHSASSIEKVMDSAMEDMRRYFGVDRAWLLAQAGDSLVEWESVAERTSMEFPGLKALDRKLVMDNTMSAMQKKLMDIDGPLAADPTTEWDVPKLLKRNFSVRSMLVMCFRSSDGHLWAVGLHQCSHDKIWKPAEMSLFKEMVRRLSDAINRLQTRQDLNESEERFRIYTDQAPLGIAVLQDNRFQYVNHAFAEIFGYESKEMLTFDREDILALVHDDDRRLVSEQMAVKQGAAGNAVENYTFRHLRKDGSEGWVEIHSLTVMQDGQPADLIMLMDITRRRELEQKAAKTSNELEALVQARTASLVDKSRELEKANARLLQLDKMKSSMLTTVSHDLRTPLTSVIGFTKLLRKDILSMRKDEAVCDEHGTLTERVLKNLDIIEDEGNHLTRLVGDFLDLSKLETGGLEWDDSAIDPVETLMVAARRGERLFAEDGQVEFTWDIPESLPTMNADPKRLEQVLNNLIGNAAKFTEKGQVQLKASSEDDQLVIQVRDTGRGVPEDEKERIFERFHRVEQGDTLRRTRRGSGLGLAICREIVDHYNGTMEVSSTLGRGSTFTVRLPV